MVANRLPFCVTLGSSSRPADRLLWLRIASDLILRTDRAGEALGSGFEAQFAECLEFTDAGTRLAIAQKLCGGMRSPERIVRAFLNRKDEAAIWTLAKAMRLPSDLLSQAARSQELSSAVAERDDLGVDLIETLLASPALETRIALAANVSAKLSRNQLIDLVVEARDLADSDQDFRLAAGLLRRSPISADLAPLFLLASPAQRSQILLAAQRAELGRDRGGAFVEISAERIHELERHAMERQGDAFEADLAAALGCSPALAGRIAADPSGEPLAVALAAIRAPNDVCVRILTSRDMAEGPDYRRLGALSRLQGALGVAAARAVISAIVSNAPDDWRLSPPQSRRRASASIRSGNEAVRKAPEAPPQRGAAASL